VGNALAKHETAGNLSPFDQAKVLEYLKLDPSKVEVQALIVACERYSLDPLLRHAVLIDGKLYVTRDGLLHVAHTTAQLDGIEVLEQGETDSHYLAKVAVHRKDMAHPFTYVGRFPKIRAVYEWRTDQYGKRIKKHIRDELHPYGPEMSVKCAEVMALRRAFDVSLSAQEEMWDSPEVYDAKPIEIEKGGAGESAAETPSSPTEPALPDGEGSEGPPATSSPAQEGNGLASDSSLLAQAQKVLKESFKGAAPQKALVQSFMVNKGKDKKATLETLSEPELVEFLDFVQKARGSR
jgi:hypothetical protein